MLSNQSIRALLQNDPSFLSTIAQVLFEVSDEWFDFNEERSKVLTESGSAIARVAERIAWLEKCYATEQAT